MTTKSYFSLAIETIATMVIVELLFNFLVANFAPTKFITFNYYAIFINTMIAGVIIFSERSSWEIKNGYLQSHFETKTLADYLCRISWIMVLLFFAIFGLSFTGRLEIIIPDKFLHLCRWPALVSGLTQGVLTLFSTFARMTEVSDHYKRSYDGYNSDDGY